MCVKNVWQTGKRRNVKNTKKWNWLCATSFFTSFPASLRYCFFYLAFFFFLSLSLLLTSSRYSCWSWGFFTFFFILMCQVKSPLFPFHTFSYPFLRPRRGIFFVASSSSILHVFLFSLFLSSTALGNNKKTREEFGLVLWRVSRRQRLACSYKAANCIRRCCVCCLFSTWYYGCGSFNFGCCRIGRLSRKRLMYDYYCYYYYSL